MSKLKYVDEEIDQINQENSININAVAETKENPMNIALVRQMF